MSDYTQLTDFSAKDLLTTGDPNKLILGSDVDAELAAIAAAVQSKYDSADIASQAEAEAGTATSKLMTPLRTEQWGSNWADENAGMIGDIHSLADPNADRILFWDDSAASIQALSVDGTYFTISGSTLTPGALAKTDVSNTFYASQVISLSPTENASSFTIFDTSGNNNVVSFSTNPTSGGTSSLVVADDALLTSHKGAVNTGTITIAPWSTTPVGIRIDGAANTVNLAGTVTIGSDAAATRGANAFTGNQTVTGNVTVQNSSQASILTLNGETGYDASIILKENSINSLIIQNDASANRVNIFKYDAAGSAAPGILTWDESGNLNVLSGKLYYDSSEVVSASNTLTLTNKTLTAPTLTSPVLNTGVSGTAVLDEDDMASDSTTQLATQQSIKAYVDTAVSGASGVLVYHSTSQSVPNNAATALAFDSESYDDNSYHDTATNNTRLTVQSGTTKVRLSGLLAWNSGFYGDTYVVIRKNGSSAYFPGRTSFRTYSQTGGIANMPIASPILEVTAGDYFELYAWQNSSVAQIAAGTCYFAMERVA